MSWVGCCAAAVAARPLFCASAVIGSLPSAGSTTSEVWRKVRVPTSLRNAPTRFSSRVLASPLSASRFAYSASVSSARLPNSAARCTGTLRRSSLDQVPEISGSPHGVFGVVIRFRRGRGRGGRSRWSLRAAGMDNAATTPIALTSAPMIKPAHVGLLLRVDRQPTQWRDRLA